MNCPRCGRLHPVAPEEGIPWDCSWCYAAAVTYSTEGIAREQAAPPALPDARGQALLPGTEGIAPPVLEPARKSPPKCRRPEAPTLFG